MSNHDPPVLAYSYIRFSTPEQANGNSLSRQLKLAQGYADSQGLVLDTSLRDLGVSAFKGANYRDGALARFRTAVLSGAIPKGSVLIVEALDRLSRQKVLPALEDFLSLIRAGITIVTLMDDQRYSIETIEADSMKLMISLLVMSRAYEESARKADRVAEVWEAKRARLVASGEVLTGRCVAWCRVEGSGPTARPVLIPERAAIVRRIFELTEKGYGRRQVASLFNREKIAPWGRGDGWQPSYVAKILGSRTVLGYFQPHRWTTGDPPRRIPDGAEIKEYYPPAVAEALYYRAHAARVVRVGGGGPKGSCVNNLFSGLAKCASCGRSMNYVDKGKKPKGGQYFVCDGSIRDLPCTDPVRWRYDAAEQAVLRGIHRLNVAKVLGQVGRPEEALAHVEEIANRLAAEERRRDRLILLLGDLDDKAVAARIRTAVEEAARLKVEHGIAYKAARATASDATSLPTRLESIRTLNEAMATDELDVRRDVRMRLVQELRRVLLKLTFTHTNVLADYVVPHSLPGRPKSILSVWTKNVPLIDNTDPAERDEIVAGALEVGEALERMAARRKLGPPP